MIKKTVALTVALFCTQTHSVHTIEYADYSPTCMSVEFYFDSVGLEKGLHNRWNYWIDDLLRCQETLRFFAQDRFKDADTYMAYLQSSSKSTRAKELDVILKYTKRCHQRFCADGMVIDNPDVPIIALAYMYGGIARYIQYLETLKKNNA